MSTFLFANRIIAQINFNNLISDKCKNSAETQIYISNNEGFCARTIFINSDNTFMLVDACESRSWVSTGKWQKQGDSISLLIDEKHINLICGAQSSGKRKSDYTKFSICDKNGNPYTNFNFSLFNNKKSLNDTITNFYFPASQEEDYADSNKIFTNNNGEYIIEKAGFKFLELQNFSVLQGSRFVISTESLPDEVKLITDFNSFQIGSNEIGYRYLNQSLKFLMFENELIAEGSVYFKFP